MATTERGGLTLIELVVCTLIVGILSATALPISKNFVRYEKEKLLRERLREVRYAIDRYYQIKSAENPGLNDGEYYPKRLDELVEKRLLRKVPIDPVTNKSQWKIRSTTDGLNLTISDGYNIFDINSLSTDIGSNDQPYNSW